jgi:hypothetical protein
MVLRTVQHGPPVRTVGDSWIATVVGQDVKVLLTDVGLTFTSFSQGLPAVRDAVPFVRDAVSLVCDAVALHRAVHA